MEGNGKRCLSCNKLLRGRMDKKFCDLICRNTFNNNRNSGLNNYVREINHILNRNRRLLETVLRGTDTTIIASGRALQRSGFDFRYYTQMHQNQQGITYFFCYEYGYSRIDENWLLLVRKHIASDRSKPDN